MSRRSVITFVTATLLALGLAGCPSPSVVGVNGPEGGGHVDGPNDGHVDGNLERQTLRLGLAAMRVKHLEELHDYGVSGVFPRNDLMPRIANVFRDDAGHLCAVANMIQKDGGNDALIDATVKDNNMIRLADVKSGPLYEWILRSGFTQEEIAMIQAPYMPPRQLSTDEERERLQQRLSEAESRLRDDTEQSLDVAVQRFVQGGARWAAN